MSPVHGAQSGVDAALIKQNVPKRTAIFNAIAVPDELLLEILKLLPPHDLERARRVNHLWREVIDTEQKIQLIRCVQPLDVEDVPTISLRDYIKRLVPIDPLPALSSPLPMENQIATPQPLPPAVHPVFSSQEPPLSAPHPLGAPGTIASGRPIIRCAMPNTNKFISRRAWDEHPDVLRYPAGNNIKFHPCLAPKALKLSSIGWVSTFGDDVPWLVSMRLPPVPQHIIELDPYGEDYATLPPVVEMVIEQLGSWGSLTLPSITLTVDSGIKVKDIAETQRKLVSSAYLQPACIVRVMVNVNIDNLVIKEF